MKLSEYVYYEKYEDTVYVRNVSNCADYLFNDSVCDILDAIKSHPEFDSSSAAEYIARRYSEDNHDEIVRSVCEMIGFLEKESIIESNPQSADMDVCSFIEEKCASEHRLHSVCFELTHRCNERCIHCYIDEPSAESRELTFSEYKALLDELRSMGCIKLLLTGGEVALHKDFYEIASYAASIGFLVDIFTNGTLITDYLFDKLCAIRPNSISYSLYGGTAKVHDNITRIKGSFDKTLRMAMMTKCAGIDTYIKTVVMNQNCEDLEELLKLGKRLNIKITPGYAVLDKRNGGSGEPFRIGEIAKMKQLMKIESKYNSLPVSDERRDPNSRVCNAGQNSLCINPYGDILPCISINQKLGNVREVSVKSVWENEKLLGRFKNIVCKDVCTKCDNCSYFEQCVLCLGRLDADAQIPEDVCTIARAVHETSVINKAV